MPRGGQHSRRGGCLLKQKSGKREINIFQMAAKREDQKNTCFMYKLAPEFKTASQCLL